MTICSACGDSIGMGECMRYVLVRPDGSWYLPQRARVVGVTHPWIVDITGSMESLGGIREYVGEYPYGYEIVRPSEDRWSLAHVSCVESTSDKVG